MDVLGRVDQVLMGGLSSDSLFMTWPDLTAIGGGLGLLIQQVGLNYRQGIRRIFEIGPGVIPAAGGGAITSGADCDNPGALALDELIGGNLAARCRTRSQPTYYIISRPEGALQIGKFIGPNVLNACFYRKYGSACSPNVITMSGKAGCSATDASAHQMTWILSGVILSDLSMNVTGQEMVFQENLGAQFTNLKLLVDNVEPNCDAVVELRA